MQFLLAAMVLFCSMVYLKNFGACTPDGTRCLSASWLSEANATTYAGMPVKNIQTRPGVVVQYVQVAGGRWVPLTPEYPKPLPIPKP